MLNKKAKNSEQGTTPDRPEEPHMGTRIRQLRESKGLTQEELGQLVGAVRASVCQWETGRTENMRIPTFMSLVRALKTTPQYLAFGPRKVRH